MKDKGKCYHNTTKIRARSVYLKVCVCVCVCVGRGEKGGKSALFLSTEGAPRVSTDARILQFVISRRPEGTFPRNFARILDKNCIIPNNLQSEPEKIHPFSQDS